MTEPDFYHIELVIRLHSAARQYCTDRYNHWSDVYDALQKSGAARIAVKNGPYTWTYSDKARDTFPRYNVLAAILSAIETFVPEDLGTLDEARRRLVAIAHRAESVLNNFGDIETPAIDEERERFATYIEDIDEADLWEMRLLPYKRTLTGEEVATHRAELETRWDVRGYWIPLVDAQIREPVLVVDANAFRKHIKRKTFLGLLRNLDVTRVYALHELPIDPCVHIDIELFTPSYGGSETFWFPESKAWLMYASHEGSLTFAGQELTRAVADMWPEHRQHPWTLG